MRAVANTAPSRRFTSRLGRVTPSVIACLAVVAGLLITAPTASAAGFSSTGVIFDSITGNTPTGSVTANATNWKAAQFITPDADANIKLVSVVLNLASNPLGTSFEVAIYDARADGSEPKDRVGQALLAPQTIVIGNNTFTPGNSFPELDKSKEYWVVVRLVEHGWRNGGHFPGVAVRCPDRDQAQQRRVELLPRRRQPLHDDRQPRRRPRALHLGDGPGRPRLRRG